jgi:hypothetical protein
LGTFIKFEILKRTTIHVRFIIWLIAFEQLKQIEFEVNSWGKINKALSENYQDNNFEKVFSTFQLNNLIGKNKLRLKVIASVWFD